MATKRKKTPSPPTLHDVSYRFDQANDGWLPIVVFVAGQPATYVQLEEVIVWLNNFATDIALVRPLPPLPKNPTSGRRKGAKS